MSGARARRNSRIREMAAAQMTVGLIARTVGVEVSVVEGLLARPTGTGLRGEARMARAAEIERRLAAGETVAAVAADLGISEHTTGILMREAMRARLSPSAPPPLPVLVGGVVRRARLVPVQPIGGGGAFGPEVEALDPAFAAADAAPWCGGRYPRSPVEVRSCVGSPAAECAALGVGV